MNLKMRPILFVTIVLSISMAYYIYTPLPSTIEEPWTLMLTNAFVRASMQLSFVAHDFGLTSPFGLLKLSSSLVEIKANMSNARVRITEESFGGAEVLVFESTAAGEKKSLKRSVVYFHGGGWTVGSANGRFPDQFNDAFQASKHILTSEVLSRYSIDPERVAVSGDSAGGNLAAAVAQQMALDSSIRVKFKVQALIYPALQALDFNTPSYQQNANMPILPRPFVVRFWLEYLNGSQSLASTLLANKHIAQDLGPEITAVRASIDWTNLLSAEVKKNYQPVVALQGDPKLLEKLPGLLDIRAAPLLAATELLEAVPPAYIMTCEHDVLRDDGLMYASRLREARVPVTVDHYEDGFHGCLSFAFGPYAFSVGKRSLGNYIHWLNENL
ncbi:hypothetical protein DNTS_007660 [Danionella cerebrum]|uniref:Neutral cholesterol ester hydrolase 1 n=1 Tax=Danionella cerebrum TaxID=2873325 RepID=A0A553Q4V5_9TELE|nr:hypothetical protein DNTS_007660 [Danionella translucida]